MRYDSVQKRETGPDEQAGFASQHANRFPGVFGHRVVCLFFPAAYSSSMSVCSVRISNSSIHCASERASFFMLQNDSGAMASYWKAVYARLSLRRHVATPGAS
jgi:hypothetical protein